MPITIPSAAVETFNATSALSHSVNLSAASVGDVRVIQINGSPDGTGTVGNISLPAGWTQAVAQTTTGAASNSMHAVFYRQVQDGDPSSITVTHTQTQTIGAICATYAGVHSAVLDVTPPAMTTGAGNAVSPSITTVTNGCRILRFAINDGAPGFTDAAIPAGTTLRGTMANNPPSNGMNMGFADAEQATAGATGTATWSGGASEEYVAATIALRPITVTYEQEGYRFRNDDGSESGATWKAAQDVAAETPKNTNIRIRVLSNATGDGAAATATLQFKRSDEAASEWRNV